MGRDRISTNNRIVPKRRALAIREGLREDYFRTSKLPSIFSSLFGLLTKFAYLKLRRRRLFPLPRLLPTCQEYLEKKYGKGAGSRMAVALERAGKSTGINFNNDRRVHNTIRSHRLVRLADEQEKAGDMIEQLFHGYFEEGKNIADSDVLLEIAQKVRAHLVWAGTRASACADECLDAQFIGHMIRSVW